MKSHFKGIRVFLVLLIATLVSYAAQPNVIFILADDLGWADTTLYGHTKFYKTPNIERLAKRGMTFTRAYSASPLCSPTRSAVLTGLSPARTGITTPNCHLPQVVLEDTLVIWGGEFGRTVFSQGKLTADNYGRDHHPRCFSIWMAGAGIKRGHVFGETDDFSYNITKDPVHIHDLNATALHLLGLDHTRLTFRFQGRNFRLTDVHGELVKGILA